MVTYGTFGGMAHMGTRTIRNVGGLDGNDCKALTRSGTHVLFEFRGCMVNERLVGQSVRV